MRNPNGYGSVVKLSGNRRKQFAIRITVGFDKNGKQIYDYLDYFSDRKEALYQLSLYNQNPYNINLKSLTLKDVFQRFYDTKKNSGLLEKTLSDYKMRFKKLAPLHNTKIINIKTIQLQTLFDNFEKESPSYIRSIKGTAKLIFDYALKLDIIDKNYASFIVTKKGENVRKNTIFTEEEQKKLWDNVGIIPGADIILVLIYTGFRIQELLSIKKENVDLENWTIKGGIKTRAGKNRIVPIHERIKHLIINFFNNPTKFLLPNPDCTTHMQYMTFRNSMFIPCMEKIGSKHYIHDTRYTFATMIMEASQDKVSIKKLIGHSNITMTEKYTITNIEKMRKEINKLN